MNALTVANIRCQEEYSAAGNANVADIDAITGGGERKQRLGAANNADTAKHFVTSGRRLLSWGCPSSGCTWSDSHGQTTTCQEYCPADGCSMP